ncbi:lactonase family protein [Pseudoalteromonas sp. JBTF-M23]|uniref:Lactonase family protein n=1 Tax=Pseudoalteromonas caenipelagi TaxID=2726988 RepID=A0A849VFY6_9GAMM|nr:beta-propeller fold lactonase family protein [Pseudoalteromonas caenipelagi]NOU52186.1 lactonase family protein [Pseudoalteromonas caenipelagi]
MVRLKGYVALFVCLLITGASKASFAIEHKILTVVQTIQDGENGVEGLDNPRHVKLSKDGKHVFIVSGDDNALVGFKLKSNRLLQPFDFLKSAPDKGIYLEGAASLTQIGSEKRIAVTSFYDGALSVFDFSNDSKLIPLQSFSDHISPKIVFKNNQPLANLDKLGLFGAWEVIQSHDGKQLLVASYKSNSVTIFNVDAKTIKLAQQVKHLDKQPKHLGNPVSIALSASGNKLFVAGFDGNIVTIYARDNEGKLAFLQQLENTLSAEKILSNPQKIIASHNGKFIYVANASNASITVFADEDGFFNHVQSITVEGLKGVGTLLLSNDGKHLFAAGEQDSGLVQLRVQANGRLSEAISYNNESNSIHGISSIEQLEARRLLLSAAKADTVYLVQLP